MEWQPIETAPKDGTHIIIIIGNWWVTCGAWVPEGEDDSWPWKFVDFNDSGEPFFNGAMSSPDNYGPTYWMPLPVPPEQE